VVVRVGLSVEQQALCVLDNGSTPESLDAYIDDTLRV